MTNVGTTGIVLDTAQPDGMMLRNPKRQMMPYDLFISSSRRDNAQGRITQLVARIQQDFAAFAGRELVLFFDHHEINGMEVWRQRILQGLRESRLLLACLSPAYLQSGYCEWEFIEYLNYEIGHLQGFNGVAPIYFVPVPGWDDPDFDQRCAAWIAELRRRQLLHVGCGVRRRLSRPVRPRCDLRRLSRAAETAAMAIV